MNTIISDGHDKLASNLRSLAITSLPKDVEFAGDIYKGIISISPEASIAIASEIQRVVGFEIQPILSFMRVENKNHRSTHWIHSDISIGTGTAILYLCDGVGGTALWEHKIAGYRDNKPNDRLYIAADEFDQSRWVLSSLLGIKFGRLVVFDSDLFHSRYPFESWGNSAVDSRLTMVTFFNHEDNNR